MYTSVTNLKTVVKGVCGRRYYYYFFGHFGCCNDPFLVEKRKTMRDLLCIIIWREKNMRSNYSKHIRAISS